MPQRTMELLISSLKTILSLQTGIALRPI